MDDVKLFGNWLELAEEFTVEQKKEFYWALIEMRQEHEVDLEALDGEVRGSLRAIKRSLEISNEKVNYFKEGRTMVDPVEVWTLAQSGLKAKTIAEKLGVGASAIYHNEGWVNRKNRSWGF